MNIGFDAFYLDGQVAMKHLVKCWLSNSQITFIGKHIDEKWPLNLVKVEVIRPDEIYLFKDQFSEQRLEISDQRAIKALLKLTRTWFFNYYSNVYKKIFIFLVICAALVWLFWQFMPKIASKVAKKIPIETELKLRPYIFNQIKDDICKNTLFKSQFEKMLGFLQAHIDNPYPAEVYLGKSSIVNAFAIPGGIILVEKGLLQKVQSQEALLGVLAHELQHLKQRHILALAIRSSAMTLLWTVALGDFTSGLTLDPATLFQLATGNKFSRDDEAEADFKGAQLLVQQGVSVLPVVHFLESLSSGPKVLEFISTHPLHDRGKPLRQAFGHIKTTRLPLTAQQWNELKKAKCGP